MSAPEAPGIAGRIAGGLVVVVVAAAGVIGLLVVLSGRDEGTFSEAGGPGRAHPDLGARHLAAGEPQPARSSSSPPTSGPHRPRPVRQDAGTLTDDQLLHALEVGNVVLLYDAPSPPTALRDIQRELDASFDPLLARAGQAVILARRRGTEGIVAAAWGRLERTSSPTDPSLREFAEHWLGRGRQR